MAASAGLKIPTDGTKIGEYPMWQKGTISFFLTLMHAVVERLPS